MGNRSYSAGPNRSKRGGVTIGCIDAGRAAETWGRHTWATVGSMAAMRKRAAEGDRKAQERLVFLAAAGSERAERTKKTLAALQGKPNFEKPDKPTMRRIVRIDPDTGIKHTLDIDFPGYDAFNRVLIAIAKKQDVTKVCPSLSEAEIEFIKTGRLSK